MIWTIAVRNVADRPWRSVFLLFGYAVGVAVMIVLLSVGEALLLQARDEKLVGGGAITVLPEGIDIEVMKTGGLGGLYFSIDHARFVHRQVLASPRLANEVTAVAPQMDGKLLYLRTRGRELAVRARGEIPSATTAVGASKPLLSGAWRDDDGDRRWLAPTPRELANEIDRFHVPPDSLPNRATWAEWHYANLLMRGGTRWAFVTLMVTGDVGRGRWGGQVLVTVRDQGGRERRFVTRVGSERVRFSTADADVEIGGSSVRVRDDGAYAIRAEARGQDGGGRVVVDVTLKPEPRAYFPGVDLRGGDVTSGYAVAGLRATASGSLCVDERCERLEEVPAYKDHNWGTWRGVTWEWGAARAGSLGLLYGRVHLPGDERLNRRPVFVYLIDSLGFRALFRPSAIAYEDGREITVGGRRLRVPSRATMTDAREADSLEIEVIVDDAIGSHAAAGIAGGETLRLARPYFIQMKGRVLVRGRALGAPFSGEGTGFFETWRE